MKTKYVVVASVLLLCLEGFTQKQKVWLDADTGNEMEDLYAIVRLMKGTIIDIMGLSSAYFNNADLLVFEKWNGYTTKNLIISVSIFQLQYPHTLPAHLSL